MDLQDAYVKIGEILQKADSDMKQIQKRGEYCPHWESLFNAQDTRILKSRAFDAIHRIALQSESKILEADSVKDLRPDKHKKSAIP